jgi:predicted SnoaL-like aldol condensation-catalyzing enzyme
MLRTIASGDAATAIGLVGADRYVDHNPAVANSPVGLSEFVRASLGEERQLRVVRALGDGAFEVTHSEGRLLGGAVFFDVFRCEGDLIVEHWMFATGAALPNGSHHAQTDGPSQRGLKEDTEANKALVREYYETVHIGGAQDKIDRYVWEGCFRHEPGVVDDRDNFKNDVAVLTQDRAIDEIRVLTGQGDFVFIAARGAAHGKPCA